MQASSESPNNASSRTVSVTEGAGPEGPVDLPLRELNDNANLGEYTRETAAGQVPKPDMSAEGKSGDWKLVTFKRDDPENPKNWSKIFKWYITMVVAFTCFVVAFASSVVTADLPGVMESFDVSREVTFLTVTVFVIGFGVGKFFYHRLERLWLIASRSYGICPHVRDGRTQTSLWSNAGTCSDLHHSLCSGTEYWNSYCLQSNRWYCLQCPNDAGRWHTSGSVEE